MNVASVDVHEGRPTASDMRVDVDSDNRDKSDM